MKHILDSENRTAGRIKNISVRLYGRWQNSIPSSTDRLRYLESDFKVQPKHCKPRNALVRHFTEPIIRVKRMLDILKSDIFPLRQLATSVSTYKNTTHLDTLIQDFIYSCASSTSQACPYTKSC